MVRKKFMVLVINYKEEHEKNVKSLLESVTKPIDSKYGETRLVYEGDDERIVGALEKVLKLTK